MVIQNILILYVLNPTFLQNFKIVTKILKKKPLEFDFTKYFSNYITVKEKIPLFNKDARFSASIILWLVKF